MCYWAAGRLLHADQSNTRSGSNGERLALSLQQGLPAWHALSRARCITPYDPFPEIAPIRPICAAPATVSLGTNFGRFMGSHHQVQQLQTVWKTVLFVQDEQGRGRGVLDARALWVHPQSHLGPILVPCI